VQREEEKEREKEVVAVKKWKRNDLQCTVNRSQRHGYKTDNCLLSVLCVCNRREEGVEIRVRYVAYHPLLCCTVPAAR
jgi:hypothetical protein